MTHLGREPDAVEPDAMTHVGGKPDAMTHLGREPDAIANPMCGPTSVASPMRCDGRKPTHVVASTMR